MYSRSKRRCRLIVRDNDENALKEKKNDIQTILGKDADIELKLVDDIPVLTSGKRKPVVNEWKKV